MTRRIFSFLLKVYKKCLSPILPTSCRHYPSCSQYMAQAVDKHGMIKGLWLGIRRVLRCHPFAEGGFDPVP